MEDGEWWVTVAEWEEECLGGGETGGDDSDEDWDEYWEDWDEDCDDEWYEDYCMEAWWMVGCPEDDGWWHWTEEDGYFWVSVVDWEAECGQDW